MTGAPCIQSSSAFVCSHHTPLLKTVAPFSPGKQICSQLTHKKAKEILIYELAGGGLVEELVFEEGNVTKWDVSEVFSFFWGLRWWSAAVNLDYLDRLLSVRQEDTWIFALSWGGHRGQVAESVIIKSVNRAFEISEQQCLCLSVSTVLPTHLVPR